ncbi:MAG TPA: hypothetical protein VH913_00790 [Hyphomicrobiaceae bacterium]|jgi:hypothetical protein
MTFYRGLCDDVLDALGRDDALRHAYRVYLWRRALSFLHHSGADVERTAGAELYSEIQTSAWGKRRNELDAERARRM